jgi:hypothetical protein
VQQSPNVFDGQIDVAPVSNGRGFAHGNTLRQEGCLRGSAARDEALATPNRNPATDRAALLVLSRTAIAGEGSLGPNREASRTGTFRPFAAHRPRTHATAPMPVATVDQRAAFIQDAQRRVFMPNREPR